MAFPRRARRVGIGAGALAFLVVLFYAEEDWRGSREWRRVEKELRAQGEPLSIEEMRPAPVPDLQNAAAAPVFVELHSSNALPPRWTVLAEPLRKGLSGKAALGGLHSAALPDMKAWEMALTGSHGDRSPALAVLEALRKGEPLVREVEQALARPSVRWPETSPDDLPREKFPYLSALIKLAQFLQLKAVAEIEAGQPDAALDTIALSFRAGWAAGQGDVAVNYLVEAGVDQITLVPVIDGLRRQAWNEAQLSRLQGLLADRNCLLRFRDALRGERVFGLRMMEMSEAEKVRSAWREKLSGEERMWVALWILRPRGWDRVDAAHYASRLQEAMIDAIRGDETLDVQRVKTIVVPEKGLSWIDALSRMALPALVPMASKAASSQAFLNEAVTACALERYRLRRGQLPAATSSLVPEFLASTPIDPVTGQPLRYAREGNAGYLLYSVGWNERDEGGIVDRYKRDGDWTWASRPDLYRFLPEKGS